MNRTPNQAENMLRGRRSRRRWGRIVSFLAAAVVFCTTYMLVLPAITMERGAISVESETDRQALGESVATVLSAEARDDAPVTYFVLRAEGAYAGLDEAPRSASTARAGRSCTTPRGAV